MPLEFDIKHITVTEFGVGREGEDGWLFTMVPVDGSVQVALKEMAFATWTAMHENTDDPPEYQPSEKHGATEHLSVVEGNELEMTMRELYNADNLPPDATALNEPADIICYFARFVDNRERHLIALRRATQFKGVLKNHLVRFLDDSLRIVEDRIFKLDSTFDLLIDSKRTHIWRPASFEFLGGLKQVILNSVPTNVAVIQQEVAFVDFHGIQRFASTHSRAARYLASIRTQDLAGIERRALLNLCGSTGVQLEEVAGMIRVADPHVIGFLEVLDRRRYEVELVPGTRERFRAASRNKL